MGGTLRVPTWRPGVGNCLALGVGNYLIPPLGNCLTLEGLRLGNYSIADSLIPFKLWEFQKELIAFIDANDRAFILKARQLGITWVVLAHALYLATFWSNREFLICSQTGDDAIAALHRLRIMHASMPARWRRAKNKDNTEQIAFDNGSRIEAMARPGFDGGSVSWRIVSSKKGDGVRCPDHRSSRPSCVSAPSSWRVSRRARSARSPATSACTRDAAHLGAPG